MEFLKRFFDDDSTIVGLCRFDRTQKILKNKNIEEKDMFFNPFQNQKTYAFNYETNLSKNILLL